ncbi:MAG: PBECR4 domain-containing protein [Oscillospiraceae bacterium]
MSNQIKECAANFENLLDKEYNIVLGKKGVTYDITLNFTEYEFKHLAGLHYLTDIEGVAGDSSKRVFDSIVNGSITDDTLKNSRFYGDICARIESLSKLESILDSVSTSYYFKYDENKSRHSRITADFIIKEGKEEIGFSAVFIEKNKGAENYYCKSIYPIEKYDPTILQSQLTLLYKEKSNVVTQERDVLYIHKNFASPTKKQPSLDALLGRAEDKLQTTAKDDQIKDGGEPER